MSRYAVYAIPGVDEGAEAEAIRLRDAVEAWYRRDELQELTIDARRYGFHATLVAPIRLADGRTEAQLRTAADVFAAARPPLVIPGVRPATIGHFRALVPQGDHEGGEYEGGDHEALHALAAAAVQEFDDFRAPLDESDIRRRRPERFTPRQRELFERWGYPYVLDEFRFHLTLTDPVPPERADEIDSALEEHFAAIVGIDVPLTAIAISVEPTPGAPFELLSVHPFADRSALETA
ncbi:uncharacterized protein DUF1045 [Glaciihabitans tibetensis]|uniref:Uncharacterized protein DUF1045 n=1 Tax=Glaciihabitans tibetensis TaxID=1266600 RepID=A0A2T0VEJ8_9MICO|nr:DUF1045 domain-containing protein [Glaciihabitans tibetensis]PRY68615.1 uncharacterized protein DUF1045 [Glaciihabitans tibetensis]